MLAIKIRTADNIKGVTISGHETRMTQYADDTTLFLNDSSSAQSAIEMLNEFKIVSGLGINMQKSCVMWLGANRMKMDSVCGISALGKVKILGVWFSARESCNEDNVKPIVKKMKNTVNSWTQRNLTIKGKIVVTKALIASLLGYIASSLTIEKADLNEVQSLIMRFIWRGRPPKVAKGTLCQDINKGGLNAVDVERFYMALKMGWVKRMVQDTEATWRKLLQARLREFNLTDLIRINKCNLVLDALSIASFYKGTISTFQKMCYSRVNNASDIRLQILWNNDEIRIDNKPVYIKHMYVPSRHKIC